MLSELKIVVCHHKDVPLLPIYKNYSELFVHVHAGRASYSGNSNFLLSMYGDNDYDGNLSLQNANCNEYSVMHWAWKSYQKIGCPAYIGLMHYSRAFTEQEIKSSLDYDMTIFENCLGKSKSPQHTLLQQFNFWHKNLIPGVEALISNAPICMKKLLERFKTTEVFYPKNMFILKKQLFFKLMEMLDSAYSQILADGILVKQYRGSGYVIERLASLVFEQFIANGHSCQFAKLLDNYI